jgi:hypothetical protein
MSQPPSPTTEQLSPLDVQDLVQDSAISDSARQERLVALERRLNTTSRSTTDPPNTSQSNAGQDLQPFGANHDRRIEFRRLVDPGILRPNSKEVAVRSLHVNLTVHFASGRTD